MRRTPTRASRVAETNGTVEYQPRLKDLPVEVRPRERLRHFGANVLSDAELLATILGTGLAGRNVLEMCTRLLASRGGLAGIDRSAIEELCGERGVGPVKAIQTKAALELGRRLVSLNPGQRAQVRSPLDIFQLVRGDMAGFEQEHLRVLLLDTKNGVLAAPDLYVGSINSTTVRVGELFKQAIRQNAAAVALVHNHPSGDPTPSPQDVELTREAVQAGRLLDVEVVDHVVVGRGEGSYVSLRERGLGFAAASR